MELENPAQNPRTFSGIKRDHIHVLQLETVLMTVYYPAAFGSGDGKAPSGHRHWSRETWLPKPRSGTAEGYGKFAGVGKLAIPWFAATTMFTKLPAYRNARLASHWPPPEKMKLAGAKVKNEVGPVPEGESKEPLFPLMIFSHGLGGTRTMYSSLCGEFASYGFVCVSVEHRDGSGPRTYVNHPRAPGGDFDIWREKTAIDHSDAAQTRGYDIIDYVFPLDNPLDSAPNNTQGIDRDLRDAQIDLRIAEIEEIYSVIRRIVNGEGEAVAAQSLRGKGFIGGTSPGLKGVDWSAWKDRVSLDDLTVSGHSFGAATVVELLRKYPKRFPQVRQGIIFDIWGAPILASQHREEPGHSNRISRPILAINSEAFTYWRSNFDLVTNLVEEARSQNVLAWMITIRGTVHISQTDFSLLYPRICSWALKQTADPKRALDLNVSASLEFLQIVMRGPVAHLTRSMQSEGLLEVEVVDPKNVPKDQLRKPNEKWIAARLTIPHELRYRLVPRFEHRRAKKKKKEQEEGSVLPQPGNEIWMHIAPSRDEVLRHTGGESVGTDERTVEAARTGPNAYYHEQADSVK